VTVASLLRTIGLGSIRSRIVAFALAATLIPTLTTAWVSYRQNEGSLRAKIAEELNGAASQDAREVDLWLKEREYEVKVFAGSYEVSENLERLISGGGGASRIQARVRLEDYLRSVQARSPNSRELLTLDREGTVMASSADTAGTIQLPQGWMQRLSREEVVLGDPAPDSLGRMEMILAVPILTANRSFLGVFAARVTFEQLGALLAAFIPGDVYLVDGTGTRLTGAGDTTMALRQAELARDTYDRLSHSDSTTVEYDRSDGTAVIGAMVSVPRVGWAVVAEQRRAAAFARIAALRNAAALLVGVLLVVVGLLAYALSLSLVRPLRRLTRGAGLVAEGDLSVTVPLGGRGGELDYLTEVFNDMVARLRDGRQELERLSTTDALTGLFNRRRGLELLEQEVARSERHDHAFAVMMIDVDHFKEYNDTYGHPAGDKVLADLGGFLKSSLREVDVVARYGGEEFLALLPQTRRDEAVSLAERLRHDVASQRPGDPKRPVTLSIGVAEFPADGDTGDAVVTAADAALYHAKEAGRDRVVAVGWQPVPEPAEEPTPKPKKAARRRKKKAT
jgi:diguanylate cyclase (GGDEF)-like protein